MEGPSVPAPSPSAVPAHDLAQARLLVATEAAQLGLWEWELTTDQLVWDHRSRVMFGQAEMPLTGSVRDIDRTIHPEDLPAVGALLERAIAERGTLEAEFRTLQPDGGERVVYARGQVLVDAEGRAVRMVGTNSDVTELRRAQREAAQDAQRQAQLVDVARALGDTTTEGEVLAVLENTVTSVFEAAMGALVLRSAEGHLEVLTTAEDPDVRQTSSPVPEDAPLPAVDSAVRGTSWFIGARAQCPPQFTAGLPRWEANGTEAVGCVPLVAPSGVFGALVVGFRAPMTWREPDRRLLSTFAALTSQALLRIRARTAELSALHAARRSAAQQAALVGLAQSMELAGTEEEVLAVVTGGAVGLLGARGAVLCLHDGQPTLKTLTTRFFGAEASADVLRLPPDLPLPMIDAATRGRTHFLPDVDSAAALHPGREEEVREMYRAARTLASAALPLTEAGAVVGSLNVAFDVERTWTPDEQALLQAFTALTATALSRIHAQEAERAASAAVRRFSETLQRSLLTRPPEPDHLHIAVRYLPAAAEAQVGGDWYDAFMVGDGATHLVVGDVTGHDREAAAAMGQVRNLLRGIAHVSGGSPAQVLSSLDAAVGDLEVGAMATVVLLKVEQTEEARARGRRVLRWSNAGHPPPLLIDPRGRVRYLETEPDLLIGLSLDVERRDHVLELEAGATLLVFTDGLVERRGAPLSEGLAWLAGAVEGLHERTVEEICDELLRQVGPRVDDDVALVALRAYPEDEPRPAEAGPVVSPISGEGTDPAL